MPSTFNDIIDGVSTSTAVKAPVRVASTSHLTLSGLQTVVGVALAADDRILVNAQTDSADNGIYDVKTGAWERSRDFDGTRDARVGTTVFVRENQLFYRLGGTDPIIIGTSDINWYVTLITSPPEVIALVDSIATLRLTQAEEDGTIVGLSGYYEPGDSPFRTFKWDAASTTDDDGGGWIQVTGVITGRWICTQLDPMYGSWYGVKYDNVTDDYDAWMAALHRPLRIDTAFFNGPHSGTTIFEERGISYVSQLIEWDAYGTWRGGGSHIVNAHSCIIRNPVDVGGIQFNSHNTTGNTTKANGGSAAGSTLEGITFQGGYYPSSTGTLGIGIRLRAQAIVRNCNVFGYAQQGVYIQAAAGSGGNTEGNCNLSRVSDVRIQNCGDTGFYADGADANACMFDRIDATANGAIGIHESSFLGNGYYSCHSDSNTDLNYKADSAAVSTFVACYQESVTPLSEFGQATIVLGGIVSPNNTITYQGNVLTADAGFLRSNRGYRSFMSTDGTVAGIDVDVRLGGSPVNGDVLYASHETYAPLVHRLHYIAPGNLDFDYGNSIGNLAFEIIGPASTSSFGRASAVPHAMMVPKLFVGSVVPSSSRALTILQWPPAAGEFAVGDVIFQLGIAAGADPGGMCTTTGVAGSTAVFKAFANLDA